jgi:hypothetical protein
MSLKEDIFSLETNRAAKGIETLRNVSLYKDSVEGPEARGIISLPLQKW